MLVELSVVEQRFQAVLAVIRDGVSIVQVAHRFGHVTPGGCTDGCVGTRTRGGRLVDRSHPSAQVLAPIAEASRGGQVWGE